MLIRTENLTDLRTDSRCWETLPPSSSVHALPVYRKYHVKSVNEPQGVGCSLSWAFCVVLWFVLDLILAYLEESYLRVFCWIDTFFFKKSKVLTYILITVAFSHCSAPPLGLGYKYWWSGDVLTLPVHTQTLAFRFRSAPSDRKCGECQPMGRRRLSEKQEE